IRLSGSVATCRRHKISFHGTVVTCEKLKEHLFSSDPVEWLDSCGDRLRVGNSLSLCGLHSRIIGVKDCDRDVAYPKYVPNPQISQHCSSMRRFCASGLVRGNS